MLRNKLHQSLIKEKEQKGLPPEHKSPIKEPKKQKEPKDQKKLVSQLKGIGNKQKKTLSLEEIKDYLQPYLERKEYIELIAKVNELVKITSVIQNQKNQKLIIATLYYYLTLAHYYTNPMDPKVIKIFQLAEQKTTEARNQAKIDSPNDHDLELKCPTAAYQIVKEIVTTPLKSISNTQHNTEHNQNYFLNRVTELLYIFQQSGVEDMKTMYELYLHSLYLEFILNRPSFMEQLIQIIQFIDFYSTKLIPETRHLFIEQMQSEVFNKLIGDNNISSMEIVNNKKKLIEYFKNSKNKEIESERHIFKLIRSLSNEDVLSKLDLDSDVDLDSEEEVPLPHVIKEEKEIQKNSQQLLLAQAVNRYHQLDRDIQLLLDKINEIDFRNASLADENRLNEIEMLSSTDPKKAVKKINTFHLTIQAQFNTVRNQKEKIQIYQSQITDIRLKLDEITREERVNPEYKTVIKELEVEKQSIINKCEITKKLIEEKLNDSQNTEEKQIKAYEKIKNSLEKSEIRLNQAFQLQSEKVAIEDKINKIYSEMKADIDRLKTNEQSVSNFIKKVVNSKKDIHQVSENQLKKLEEMLSQIKQHQQKSEELSLKVFEKLKGLNGDIQKLEQNPFKAQIQIELIKEDIQLFSDIAQAHATKLKEDIKNACQYMEEMHDLVIKTKTTEKDVKVEISFSRTLLDISQEEASQVCKVAQEIKLTTDFIMTNPDEAKKMAHDFVKKSTEHFHLATEHLKQGKEKIQKIEIDQKSFLNERKFGKKAIILPSLKPAEDALTEASHALEEIINEAERISALEDKAKTVAENIEETRASLKKIIDITTFANQLLKSSKKLFSESKQALADVEKKPRETLENIIQINKSILGNVTEIEKLVAETNEIVEFISQLNQFNSNKLPDIMKSEIKQIKNTAKDKLFDQKKIQFSIRKIAAKINKIETDINFLLSKSGDSEKKLDLSKSTPFDKIEKDDKLEIKNSPKHLPDSFSIDDIKLITPAKKEALIKMKELQNALKAAGIDFFVRGSFVVECAMGLLDKDPIIANDIDGIIEISESKLDKLELLHTIMAANQFTRKELEVDSNGYLPTFYSFVFEQGKEGAASFSVDITVTLPSYQSTNSFPLTGNTMEFVECDDPKEIRFKFSDHYQKEPKGRKQPLNDKQQLEYYILNEIFPLLLPDPTDKHTRAYFSRFLKWRQKGKLKPYFMGKELDDKTWSDALFNYFDVKFSDLSNPKAGFDCYGNVRRIIKENNFNHPDAKPIIFNFCLALIHRTIKLKNMADDSPPSMISKDQMQIAANDLTDILQEFYKKYPHASDLLMKITNYLLHNITDLLLKNITDHLSFPKVKEIFIQDLEKRFIISPQSADDTGSPMIKSPTDWKRNLLPYEKGPIHSALLTLVSDSLQRMESHKHLGAKHAYFKIIADKIYHGCKQDRLSTEVAQYYINLLYQKGILPYQEYQHVHNIGSSLFSPKSGGQNYSQSRVKEDKSPGYFMQRINVGKVNMTPYSSPSPKSGGQNLNYSQSETPVEENKSLSPFMMQQVNVKVASPSPHSLFSSPPQQVRNIFRLVPVMVVPISSPSQQLSDVIQHVSPIRVVPTLGAVPTRSRKS